MMFLTNKERKYFDIYLFVPRQNGGKWINKRRYENVRKIGKMKRHMLKRSTKNPLDTQTSSLLHIETRYPFWNPSNKITNE